MVVVTDVPAARSPVPCIAVQSSTSQSQPVGFVTHVSGCVRGPKKKSGLSCSTGWSMVPDRSNDRPPPAFAADEDEGGAKQTDRATAPATSHRMHFLLPRRTRS